MLDGVVKLWKQLLSSEIFNIRTINVKYQSLLASAIFIVALSFFYKDVVFFGRTFLIETADAGTMPTPSDGPYNYKGVKPGFVARDTGAIAWLLEPFNRFISESIKKGDFPLWNPYSGLAGSPLFADGQTAPFEPIQFLFFFTPERFWAYAVDLQLLIRFLISGFFCYLFARRLRIDFLGSIVVGVLFIFSGYFVSFGNHPQVKTEALLPLVLYGFDRVADMDDKQGVWICAFFIGWAIIAGMPEATFFPLFLGTLWYFYKTIVVRRVIGVPMLIRYIGTTGIGFLISAVYLLPLFELISLSKSVHQAGSSAITHWPFYEVPGLIFGTVDTYFIRIGFVAFFSLFFSIISLKDWPDRRREILFFSGYASILLISMFDFPPTNWIVHLPILNQVGMLKYPFPSINFCIAILIGFIVDRTSRYPLSNTNILLALFLVFTCLILVPILVAPEGIRSFDNIQGEYNTLMLPLGLSFALVFLNVTFETRTRFLQIGFIFIATFEVFLGSSLFNRPSRVYPFQAPPFVNYLRKDTSSFRILGLDHILYPNISTAYQLQDIRWLNALVSQRTYEFSKRFIETDEIQTLRFTGSTFPHPLNIMNLLNVKYILLKNSHNASELPKGCPQSNNIMPEIENNELNKMILQQNIENKNVSEQKLIVNGVMETAIYAPPLGVQPQVFTLRTMIPSTPSSLDFSIGLNPAVFSSDRGDGVNFYIAMIDSASETKIFSKYLDPKQEPCDRRWFDESVPLNAWAGREVTIKFSTDGGPVNNTAWDWAYWGNIQLIADGELDERDQTTRQFSVVYHDRDVEVYKNINVLPRAFVVYDVVNANDFETALDKMDTPQFDPSQMAVVENLPSALTASINQNKRMTQKGEAQLVSSGQTNVVVKADAPGLLVVTDQYYPGWEAFVDGEPVPTYAVDGIFRGVFLEKGSHMIKFIYRPLTFVIGGIISAVSLLITIVFLMFNSVHHKKRLE